MFKKKNLDIRFFTEDLLFCLTNRDVQTLPQGLYKRNNFTTCWVKKEKELFQVL